MNAGMKKVFAYSACAVLFGLLASISFAQAKKSPQASQPQNIDGAEVYERKQLDDKAVVVKNVEPTYTKKARKHKTSGTVVLRCIFRSTGEVTDITVVSGLPNGLTERAIEAARDIKFIPAMKNGHRVSTYVQLEYEFHLD